MADQDKKDVKKKVDPESKSQKKPAEKQAVKKEALSQEVGAADKAAKKTDAVEQASKKPQKKTEVVVKEGEVVSAPVVRKKKPKRSVPVGKVFVHATFNNTIITITDPTGNVLTWSSAGSKGFKGARKGTPFAAQIAAEDACKRAAERYGLRTVDVMVKGPGGGRESSLRALQSAGIRVSYIKDVTPIPHNGCRPPKKRRV